MTPFEQATLENIERYGCSIISVPAESDLPPFSYSVGIWKNTNAPEAILIGLPQQTAHTILNQYHERVREGEIFTPGQSYPDFLEGYDIAVRQVDTAFYDEYFGVCQWLYKGTGFPAIQLVYPDRRGRFPWSEDAHENFRAWQPILHQERNDAGV
jgi:hypothetical protein